MGLLALARVAELAVAALVVYWASAFRSSFHHHSSPTSHLDFLYSVLHPVLMVIGFILLTGEAILAHRWLEGWSRGTRKSVHLLLQGAAFGFGVLGIWAKFRGERGVVANFYSLHSWLGLLCLALFAAQWVVGFLTFWHRGEGRRSRAAALPWHVFLGLYTYGLAVATAETGLLEKLTFLQRRGRVAIHSAEAKVVNGIGLGLALLGGVVVFVAAVSPKKRSRGGGGGATSNHVTITVNGYYNGDGNGNAYQNGKFADDDSDGKWKSHAGS